MRRCVKVVLLFCLVLALAHSAAPKETRQSRPIFERSWSPGMFAQQDAGILPLADVDGRFTAAQVDTYVIVHYDFEPRSWQGWTRADNTAEIDTFWHVEDYAEPGLTGLPGPLEGAQSAWCGAPPGDDEYMCAWGSAPGYGNNWDQRLVSEPIWFTGLLTFSYRLSIDTEPGYDRVYVEYDGGGAWNEIARYEGLLDTLATHGIYVPKAVTKLRFRFVSDVAWSDEDGHFDSDGAAHLDNVMIGDEGGTIDYEDFESAADGDRAAGIWRAGVKEPFGLYSGLDMGFLDKDPCNKNIRTQAAFFYGSTYPSVDYPALYETPHSRTDEFGHPLNQDEMIVSPAVDMTKYSTTGDRYQDSDIPAGVLPHLGGAKLKFTVYRDMPLNPLSRFHSRFYFWRVRSVVAGCPGEWLNRYILYYGDEKAYIVTEEEIGDLVGSDPIQVGLGIVDLCDPWYGGCSYNPTPWFDNVRVERYVTTGPQWTYRDVDLFQDNFPGVEFDLQSYVRADAAIDLRPLDEQEIDPGDSVVVGCASNLTGGIRENVNGPEVYMHVRCGYIGVETKPDLYGPALEGTYGTYVGDDGVWTVIQGEPARTPEGDAVPDRYMFDLNDSLLTRGYRIDYYFKAFDLADEASTLPTRAETEDIFFEFTCLPTLNSDILYVDDYHGIGSPDGIPQQYWESVMGHCVPSDTPFDRYDVNGPSSCVSNGPGSRAKNFQMTTAYLTVIWDSGDLRQCTISEGTTYSDKSNDAQLLVDWMEFSYHRVGLWVCGDDVAADLDAAPSGVALTLLSTYCGVRFEGDSYYDLGGIVSPLVEADSSADNPLWHTTRGDSFYVHGGCPVFNRFDYLEKAGPDYGYYALRYPDVGGQPYYAGIYNEGTNDGGYDIRTMWFGFSFMYLREATREFPLMRDMVALDVLEWMNHALGDPFDVGDIPAVNSLAQNHPNPFNPTTTISFGLRERGAVSLKIYDAAGRLVRTLVDEVREAGTYRETWDGRNNRGTRVASGIYFYRMKTPGFVWSRKMALLR